jgi:WD40 repeat protein
MFLCHQEALSIDTAAHAPAADTSSDKRLVALSFIPDGSALITQGADGSVKVWDTETGRMRFAVGGPAQPVHWYTVDPLGHRLAVAGRDGAIQVLEMANGREVLSVVHGTNVACCTALGPAGRQLVTGGGGVVCVWDVERKECLRRWEVGTVAFERFELNEDATRLATKQGRLTRVWEVNTGAELLSVVPPITNCLSYTMNGSVSAGVAFDTDNRAWLWRTNGTCVDLGLIRGSTWESHRWASFAANGQLFCTGGDQCTARVWDSLTARERFTLPGRITGAEFSPDSTRLLTRGEESVARIWDVGTAQEVRTLRGHYAIVERACFSPNGRLVATADQDGAVKLWSASNGREVLAGDSWPWGACYSADGERLACISSPLLDLRVWDSDSGAELLRFRPGMEHCCVHARFSPDGRFLATGGAGGDVRLWDSETGREVRRFYGHTEFVVPVAFSPSGKMLAAGAMDGTARLWDVESGNLLRVFQRPARGVTWVLFSPESSRLYVGSADGFVRAYDPQSGQLQIEIGESQPSAAMLTFSLTPDGRHLYTADWLNNTRRAWNTLTGRPLPGSHEPQRAGFLSAFTPDGHRMAVVFQDTRRGYGNSESTCVIMDVVSGRHVLALPRARDNVGSLLFSPSGRRLLNTDGSNFTTRQWETFPWREEEYLEEGRNQKAEGGGQRSKIRGQELDLTFLTRVRAYADRYWRERLRAEATAKPAPPREPMVRWDRSLWPKRDERSGPNQIDLIEHYTTRLDVPLYPSCIGSTADDDLRNLPCGTVVLSEVTFDIRGVTMLRCLMSRGYPFRWLWEQHPERIEGIEVPKTFRRLQVLHGMHHYDSMGVEDGATIGRYVLHYSDGTSAELPIVLGRHVRNWWAQEGEENPLAPLPEGTVAWTGSNPSAMDAKATLRLYLTSYENPHPEKKVVRVDFVSAMTTAAPFLVAMTVEP